MKKIHLIGVGGIGVSALAQYYLAQGYQVSGSDSYKNEIIESLEEKGLKFLGLEESKNIDEPDFVVYSAAVKENNLELRTVIEKNIPHKLYAEALGEITKDHFTIAVSGTHGKSTTTSLIALILTEAGLDPTVIVGTKIPEFGGANFRLGKSKYLVIEADEYNRHMLNYYPNIEVITNIEADHLDIYGNLENIIKSFVDFAKNLKPGGCFIGNGQDPNVIKVSRYLKSGQTAILFNKNKIAHHELKLIGLHNQFNAEAAWQVAKVLKVDEALVKNIFRTHTGTWRRLEKIKPGIYSDYSHHPTEIKASLQAVKEAFPDQKIVGIFQPHQQDRLNRLFDDFLTVFDQADLAIILPLYYVKGRETLQGKTSTDLVEAINNPKIVYAENFQQAQKILEKEPRAIKVFMSAGDLDEWVRQNYK